MTARLPAAFLVIVFLFGRSSIAPAQENGARSASQEESEAALDSVSLGMAVVEGLLSEASAGTKPQAKAAPKAALEKATFGGGCFWSMEAIFERIPGVKAVVSGFAGGNVPRPSYELVCTGQTGHAEVIQIQYDPQTITYDQLLKVFFSAHDPTSLNRQGEDEGPNYRSIILYHSEEQRQAALKFYQQLNRAGVFARPIVTELVPLRAFYPADKHHQDYFRRHRTSEYCQMVIVPKLEKLGLVKHK